MKLPAYPRYKSSGIEWLGDVPEHWTPIALRRIATRYAGGTPDRSNDSYWNDGTIPWISSGAVNQGLVTEPSAFITEEAYQNSSARWVAKGALVMALAGQGKTKGMVAQTGIATTCNQSMAAICPATPMEARYLYWLLVSQYEHIRNMAGGEARDGLNLEILGAISCLKVPPVEQRAIATFLDRETERMDRLVAKKRDLIERLKEKRTALISRTVTRGLPAEASAKAGIPINPPLKPSGLDWLGHIPAHWSVTKLKRICSVRGRIGFRGYTTDDLVDADEGALALGATHMHDHGGIDLRQPIFISWPKFYESPEIVIEVGDLLVAERGSTSGKVALISQDLGPATINPSVVLLKAPSANGRFLLYLLIGDCIQCIFKSHLSATAIPMLSQEQIGNIDTVIPPLSEQTVIAEYLDEETAKLDALVGKVEEAVERLQEYRTALITAAVTGKIDVRRAVSA